MYNIIQIIMQARKAVAGLRTLYTSSTYYAQGLGFGSGHINPYSGTCFYGFPVRPVCLSE